MNSLTNPERAITSLESCHVLLWSQSQCAMHIEPVSSMLTHNRRAYVEDRRMDYVPIAFGTRDLCSALAEKVRQTLNKRRG